MLRYSWLHSAAALMIGAVCLNALAGEAEPPPGFSFDGLARQTMNQYGIPGMSIGMITGGSRLVCHYGLASLDTAKPVDDETLFEIGSLSKLFAAALASVAQAKGKLSLTDPPAAHLDWLEETALGGASLLNLATHTGSGLPLFVPDKVSTRKQVQAYFTSFEPRYEPGAQRTYSNPGIGLLGRAAAASLGADYIHAVRHELLEPLNMTRTYFSVPNERLGDYAQGYTVQGEPVRLASGALADEAYGLKSTAADLLAFLEANLAASDGRSELGRALSVMQTGFYRIGPMTQALVWERYRYPVELDTLIEGNSTEMALGTHAAQVLLPPVHDESAWINKTGSTNGFAAYLVMLPAQGRGVVILANRNYPAEARIRLAWAALTQAAGTVPGTGSCSGGMPTEG